MTAVFRLITMSKFRTTMSNWNPPAWGDPIRELAQKSCRNNGARVLQRRELTGIQMLG